MNGLAGCVLVAGWGLDLLSLLWIALLLLKLLWSWVAPARAHAAGWRAGIGQMIEAPVNAVRRTVPTVYRRLDLALWLTLLLLVLARTFVFRAMIYWGILHR